MSKRNKKSGNDIRAAVHSISTVHPISSKADNKKLQPSKPKNVAAPIRKEMSNSSSTRSTMSNNRNRRSSYSDILFASQVASNCNSYVPTPYEVSQADQPSFRKHTSKEDARARTRARNSNRDDKYDNIGFSPLSAPIKFYSAVPAGNGADKNGSGVGEPGRSANSPLLSEEQSLQQQLGQSTMPKLIWLGTTEEDTAVMTNSPQRFGEQRAAAVKRSGKFAASAKQGERKHYAVNNYNGFSVLNEEEEKEESAIEQRRNCPIEAGDYKNSPQLYNIS
jgi:hypothetical protein